MDKLRDDVNRFLNPPRKIEDVSDDLQGEGMKIVIPSNFIDIWTRLEVLLGLKLFGHTDTFAEASYLIDELCKKR